MNGARDRILERKLYPAGKVIFAQGESGDAAFVIESGSVAITLEDDAGRTIRLGTLTKGGLFGEMAVIDGSPRMATARVEEGAVLVRIPGEQMRSKLGKADPFLRAVLKMLLDNLRDAHGVHPPADTLLKQVEGLSQAVLNIRKFCSLVPALDGDPDFQDLLQRQERLIREFEDHGHAFARGRDR